MCELYLLFLVSFCILFFFFDFIDFVGVGDWFGFLFWFFKCLIILEFDGWELIFGVVCFWDRGFDRLINVGLNKVLIVSI